MRTSNPALSDDAFRYDSYIGERPLTRSTAMSMNGTVAKTAVLFAILFGGAVVSWTQIAGARLSLNSNPTWMMILIGSFIGALILSLVTCFKPRVAPYTAPVYALLEGIVLGAISQMFEGRFQGIVFQAILLTLGVAGLVLTAYATRLIRATPRFQMMIMLATGGIMMAYLATFVLGFFGVRVPYIHDSGLIGILFSVFVVGIAALNLVLDFDTIERGVERGAPKYMEWYGGFAIMVTMVWLYLEVLRLLSKLRSSD